MKQQVQQQTGIVIDTKTDSKKQLLDTIGELKTILKDSLNALN